MARINHLAIVTDDMEKSLNFWRDALGLKLGKRERNEGEEVDIAFLPFGDGEPGAGEIELLAPINQTSGIARYLAKRGAGMHHICLEVDDIEQSMARLRDHGVELINDVPKTDAQGTRYAFVHPRSASGILVELYEVSHD